MDILLIIITLWGPDVRVTNSVGSSKVSNNISKTFTVVGDTVHLVYCDSSEGNFEIYYKKSSNFGQTWGDSIRLTWASGFSTFPSVFVYWPNVHVVWQDNGDNAYTIYYCHSTDGGLTWGSNYSVASGTSFRGYPSICGYENTIMIMWSDKRTGNWDLYGRRSTDGGNTWEDEVVLESGSSCSWSGCGAMNRYRAHIVWQDNRDGNFEIYYRRSTDAGATWGSEVRLTNTSTESYSPVIAVSGQNLHIAWREGNFTPDTIIADTTSDYNIYYMKSTDDGLTWGTPIKLNSNSRRYRSYPSLSVVGSMVNVVWEENWWFDGHYIYPCWTLHFVRSVNNGNTWSVDTCLVKNNNCYALSPTIALRDSLIGISWCDNRDGNWEVYFKKGILSGGVYNDIAVNKIISPAGDTVWCDSVYTPTVEIENIGWSDESVKVYCFIEDSVTGLDYQDSTNWLFIEVDSVSSISFSDWQVDNSENTYLITFISKCSNDWNPFNDTLTKVVRALPYGIGDYRNPALSISETDISILPNPSATGFTVYLPVTFLLPTITIFDASGRVIYQMVDCSSNRNRIVIDQNIYEKLASGIYFVEVKIDRKIWRKKVIKVY